MGKRGTSGQITEIIGGVSRNANREGSQIKLICKIKTIYSFKNDASLNSGTVINQRRGRKSKFKSLVIESDFEPENPKQLEELMRILV